MAADQGQLLDVIGRCLKTFYDLSERDRSAIPVGLIDELENDIYDAYDNIDPDNYRSYLDEEADEE